MEPVNDPIKDSALLAAEWQQQEAQAYANAALWLGQAARGEIPHDEPTKETTSEQSPT